MEGNSHNPKINNSTYFLLLGTLATPESDAKDEAPSASLVGKPVEISKEIAEHLLETFSGSKKKEVVPEPPLNRTKKPNIHHAVPSNSPLSKSVLPSRPSLPKYDDNPGRNINHENSTNSLLEELVQTSIPVLDKTTGNFNSQEESNDVGDCSFRLYQQKSAGNANDCDTELQNRNNDYPSCSSSLPSSLSKSFRHSDSKTDFDSSMAKRKINNEKQFENVGASPKKKSCIFRKNDGLHKTNVTIQDSDDSDIEDLDAGESGDSETFSRQWNTECRCSECRAKFS